MSTPDPPRPGRPRVGEPGGDYTTTSAEQAGRRIRNESKHVTWIPRPGQAAQLTEISTAALGPKKRNEYVRRIFDTFLELHPRIADAAQHEGVADLDMLRTALVDGLNAADRRIRRAAAQTTKENQA